MGYLVDNDQLGSFRSERFNDAVDGLGDPLAPLKAPSTPVPADAADRRQVPAVQPASTFDPLAGLPTPDQYSPLPAPNAPAPLDFGLPHPNDYVPGGQPMPAAAPGASSLSPIDANAARNGDLVPNQFGDPELSPEEAAAACGPAAAVAFSRANGRNPTLKEALDLARQYGWTAQGGMNGIGNQSRLLDALQVPHTTDVVGAGNALDWRKVTSAAQNGQLVTVSTPVHYFVIDQYDPTSGAYHVGKSGTAFKAGGDWLTQRQMESLGGEANGALYLTGGNATPASSLPRPDAPVTTPLRADSGDPGVLRWSNVITQVAGEEGVPASVLAAFMEIESHGDPNARSSQGANGLMQVVGGPMDPLENVRAAARLIKDKQRIFGLAPNDWSTTAAAYFGAYNPQRGITGDQDAGGTSGYDYVKKFNAALLKYRGGLSDTTSSPSGPSFSDRAQSVIDQGRQATDILGNMASTTVNRGKSDFLHLADQLGDPLEALNAGKDALGSAKDTVLQRESAALGSLGKRAAANPLTPILNPGEAAEGAGKAWSTYQSLEEQKHGFIEEHNPLKDVPVVGGLTTGLVDTATDPLTYVAGGPIKSGVETLGKGAAKALGPELTARIPGAVKWAAEHSLTGAGWGGLIAAEDPNLTPERAATDVAGGAAFGLGAAAVIKAAGRALERVRPGSAAPSSTSSTPKPLSPEEQAQAQATWRQLVKAVHPDTNPDADPKLILQVNEAYRNGNLSELQRLAREVGVKVSPTQVASADAAQNWFGAVKAAVSDKLSDLTDTGAKIAQAVASWVFRHPEAPIEGRAKALVSAQQLAEAAERGDTAVATGALSDLDALGQQVAADAVDDMIAPVSDEVTSRLASEQGGAIVRGNTFPGVPEYSPEQARSLVQRAVATSTWHAETVQESDTGQPTDKPKDVLVLGSGPLAVATDQDGMHQVVMWPPSRSGGSLNATVNLLPVSTFKTRDLGAAQAAAVQLRQSGIDFAGMDRENDYGEPSLQMTREDQDAVDQIAARPYDVLRSQQKLNRLPAAESIDNGEAAPEASRARETSESSDTSNLSDVRRRVTRPEPGQLSFDDRQAAAHDVGEYDPLFNPEGRGKPETPGHTEAAPPKAAPAEETPHDTAAPGASLSKSVEPETLYRGDEVWDTAAPPTPLPARDVQFFTPSENAAHSYGRTSSPPAYDVREAQVRPGTRLADDATVQQVGNKLGYESQELNGNELIAHADVRHALTSAGYDGARIKDGNEDVPNHVSVAVWNKDAIIPGASRRYAEHEHPETQAVSYRPLEGNPAPLAKGAAPAAATPPAPPSAPARQAGPTSHAEPAQQQMAEAAPAPSASRPTQGYAKASRFENAQARISADGDIQVKATLKEWEGWPADQATVSLKLADWQGASNYEKQQQLYRAFADQLNGESYARWDRTLDAVSKAIDDAAAKRSAEGVKPNVSRPNAENPAKAEVAEAPRRTLNAHAYEASRLDIARHRKDLADAEQVVADVQSGKPLPAGAEWVRKIKEHRDLNMSDLDVARWLLGRRQMIVDQAESDLARTDISGDPRKLGRQESKSNARATDLREALRDLEDAVEAGNAAMAEEARDRQFGGRPHTRVPGEAILRAPRSYIEQIRAKLRDAEHGAHIARQGLDMIGATLPADASGAELHGADGRRAAPESGAGAPVQPRSAKTGVRAGQRVSRPGGSRNPAAGVEPESERPAAPRGVGPGDSGRVADGLAEGRDYRLTPADERWQENTPAGQRFEANVDAIRRVKEVLDGRPLTEEDRSAFARFSGMGDSAYNAAFPNHSQANPNARLVALGQQLKQMLGRREYASLGQSRINAHFTSPAIVRAMWEAMERFGTDALPNPKILEPAAGSGRFIALMPDALHDRASITAIEKDLMTGEMLKHLFPQASVHVMGTERIDVQAPGAVPDGSQDIVISNVPFGNVRVADPAFAKTPELTHSIHNYFFAKGLAKARPGGIVAFITSHFTMDAARSSDVRRYLAAHGELLGAIRLPQDAFPDTAVTTDILFFRKREAPVEVPSTAELRDMRRSPTEFSWVEAIPHSAPFKDQTVNYSINRYFLDHPEMALGKHAVSGHTTTGIPDYVLEKDDWSPERLREAIKKLPENVLAPYDAPTGPSAATLAAGRATEGSFVEHNGKLHTLSQGEMKPAGRWVKRGKGERTWTPYSDKEVGRIRAMLQIHDLGREVLDLQRAGAPAMKVDVAQARLKRAYDTFVRANGPLHTQTNRSLLKSDGRTYWLQSLEKWGEELEKAFTKREGKPVTNDELNQLRGDIFTKYVQAPPTQVRKAETPKDAFAIVLNQLGHLDLDAMATTLDRPADEVARDLHRDGLIYRNPEVGQWETADEYLSGNVKAKLAAAEAAAADHEQYRANVEALKKVQPAPLEPGKSIDVRLGSAWIPAEDVNRFVGELLFRDPERAQDTFKLQSGAGLSKWIGPDRPSYLNHLIDPEKLNQWGTERMHPLTIIDHAMNGVAIRIMDNHGTSRDPVYVLNEEATRAANGKMRQVKAEFVNWLWSDPDRGIRLADLYNDRFNNTVNRSFDGSHLTFTETNPAIQLRPHQKDGVWRAVQSPTTLFAHEVGYGKSMTMAATAMEWRRLGLSRKPAIVVPNHLVGQMAAEFWKLYPQANLLVPTAADYDADNRAALMARIAGGDWDAVIFPQSQFKLLPVHPQTELKYLEQLKDELSDVINSYQGDKDERSFKDLQKRLSNAHADIQRASDRLHEFQVGRKGELTWDDLGIDGLMVDEADAYKNLQFFTTRTRVKGLPNSRADRAFDMFTKTRHLLDTHGRGLVFATGTPISNTIAELWTMLRYLAPQTMKDLGLDSFDGWASIFADTVENMEQTTTGEWKVVTRFARFANLPELSRLFQKVADIRMAEDSPEMEAKKPKLKGGRRIPIKSPMTAWHRGYLASLLQRSKELGGKPEKGGDNFLKITGDARKASLDPSLVGGPRHPEGKIPKLVNQVFEVYQREQADKGTQLVFLDIGTPKSSDGIDKSKLPTELRDFLKQRKAEAGESWDPDDEAATIKLYFEQHGLGDPLERQAEMDVYNRIRDMLVERGIPRNEVMFIHEAKDDKQRKALFQLVNSGEVRVLIGSTEKMGAGTNVQERLAAIHHLDTPWRPRDEEQREGRGLRPGNKVYGPRTDEFGEPLRDARGQVMEGPGVEIYQYITEWPFDAFQWSTLLAKIRAIKSFMRRNVTERSMADVDDFQLDAESLEALASGDPVALKRRNVQEELRQLEAEEGDHLSRQAAAGRNLRVIPENEKFWKARIPELQADKALRDKAPNAFKLTVDGRGYDKRPEAGQALLDAVQRTHDKAGTNDRTWKPIGAYKGFTLETARLRSDTAGVRLRNPAHTDESATVYDFNIYVAEMSGNGLVTRVENLLRQVDSALTYAEQQLPALAEQKAAAQRFLKTPYAESVRLQQLRDGLAMIERRMTGEKKTRTVKQKVTVNGEEKEVEQTLPITSEQYPDGEPIFTDEEIDAVLEGVPRSVDRQVVPDPQAAALAAEEESEPPTGYLELPDTGNNNGEWLDVDAAAEAQGFAPDVEVLDRRPETLQAEFEGRDTQALPEPDSAPEAELDQEAPLPSAIKALRDKGVGVGIDLPGGDTDAMRARANADRKAGLERGKALGNDSPEFQQAVAFARKGVVQGGAERIRKARLRWHERGLPAKDWIDFLKEEIGDAGVSIPGLMPVQARKSGGLEVATSSNRAIFPWPRVANAVGKQLDDEAAGLVSEAESEQNPPAGPQLALRDKPTGSGESGKTAQSPVPGVEHIAPLHERGARTTADLAHAYEDLVTDISLAATKALLKPKYQGTRPNAMERASAYRATGVLARATIDGSEHEFRLEPHGMSPEWVVYERAAGESKWNRYDGMGYFGHSLEYLAHILAHAEARDIRWQPLEAVYEARLRIRRLEEAGTTIKREHTDEPTLGHLLFKGGHEAAMSAVPTVTGAVPPAPALPWDKSSTLERQEYRRGWAAAHRGQPMRARGHTPAEAMAWANTYPEYAGDESKVPAVRQFMAFEQGYNAALEAGAVGSTEVEPEPAPIDENAEMDEIDAAEAAIAAQPLNNRRPRKGETPRSSAEEQPTLNRPAVGSTPSAETEDIVARVQAAAEGEGPLAGAMREIEASREARGKAAEAPSNVAAAEPPESAQPSESSFASESPVSVKESGEPKYEFQSTQANLPADLAAKVQRYQRLIDVEDLGPGGLETQPHITLKYGLHEGVSIDDVRRALADTPPIAVTFGRNESFPDSGDGAVLYIAVDSPALHRLNGLLSGYLPNTDTQPEYTPHVTVGYLKPEAIEKYVGEASPLAGTSTTLDTISFSDRDGNLVDIPLTGKARSNGHTNGHTNGLATNGAIKPPVSPPGSNGHQISANGGGNGTNGTKPPAPPTPPEPPAEGGDERQHVVGYGYMSGETAEELAAVEKAASDHAERRIGQAEIARAAQILQLDQAGMERLRDAALARSEGGLATESQALRTQAIGAINTALDLAARHRAAAAKQKAGQVLTDDDKLALDDAAMEAVRAATALDVKASRRFTAEIARALAQHKHEVTAQTARGQYQRLDQLADVLEAATKVLEAATNGHTPGTIDLESVAIAVEQLETNGHLVPETSAVATTLERLDAGTSPAPALAEALKVSDDVAKAITDRPASEDIARQLIKLTPEWRAARAAGEWDRVNAIEKQRADLIEQIRTQLADELPKPKPPEEGTELPDATKDVEGRAARGIVAKIRRELARAQRIPDPDRDQALSDLNDAVRKLVLEQEVAAGDLLPKSARLAEMNRQQADARGRGDYATVARIERERDRVLDAINTELERQVAEQLKKKNRYPDKQALERAVQEAMGKGILAHVRKLITEAQKYPTRELDRRIEKLEKKAARVAEKAQIDAIIKKLRYFADQDFRPGNATQNLQGIAETYQQLHAISAAAKARASDVREAIYKAGLRQYLMKDVPEDRMDALVGMLMTADPEHPEQLGVIVRALRKAKVWDFLREFRIINMLSSPLTWGFTGVNFTSNAMMAAGRIVVAMPLDALHDSVRHRKNRHIFFSEVGAALGGAKKALPKSAAMGRDIMVSGNTPDAYRAAAELGDLRAIRREYLTEKFGWLGEWAHRISTRPLEAMDAFQGNTLYGGMLASLAHRKALQMARANDPYVRGLTTVQAREKILRNVWDFPEILDEAGNVEQYSLFRGKPDRVFQAIAKLRSAPPDAKWPRQVGSYLFHHSFPFAFVPYFFARIGGQHSAPGVLYEVARYAGEKDPYEQARRFHIAVAGAAIFGMGLALLMGDNLTGDGPSDPSEYKLWSQSHQPHSIRVPGTQIWWDYNGTFFAIPLSMIANFGESFHESYVKQGRKFNGDNALNLVAAGVGGGAKGALTGFASQTFVRTAGDIVNIIQGTKDASTLLASQVSQYFPLGSMIAFLSRLGDSVDRESKTFTEDLLVRTPLRGTLKPNLDPLGREIENAAHGLAGILPFRPNPKPLQNDAVLHEFERLDVNIPDAPRTIRNMPLSEDERYAYEKLVGPEIDKAVQKAMQSAAWSKLDDAKKSKVLSTIVSRIRDKAEAVTLKSIPKDELLRRIPKKAA